MGPDLSIYSGYMREPKSVNEYRAEADAQDLNALRLMIGKQGAEAGQMKLDEARRGIADQNALRSIYAEFGDDQNANYNALLRVNPGAANDYRKQLLDAQEAKAKIGKLGAETRNTDQDAIKKRMEFYRGQLDSMVTSPQVALQWLQAQYQDPILGPVMSQMMPLERAAQSIKTDPQGFAEWRNQSAMGMEKYLTDMRGRATQAETVRHNLASEANTVRGQNVTDARARESANRPTFNADLGAWVDPAKQTVTPATGPDGKALVGGGGKATDGEKLGAGYYSRMQQATTLLDKYEKGGRAGYMTAAAGGVPFVGGALRTKVSSEEQQLYRQAQEDWVRSKLRKESGAVIGPKEMEDEITTYFPQPGEGEAVAAQKRRARAVATEAMKRTAGRAAYESEVPEASGGVTVTAPNGKTYQFPTEEAAAAFKTAAGIK